MPFVDESEIRIGKGKDGDDGTEQLPGIDPTKTKLVKGAVDEFERLSTSVFPDLRLGLLHGRMSLKEKELVMAEYQNGEIDILVSTPVIEVGIDVPNATVMLIDGADRFGLAQLHQFRGRVGRGEHQSYCLLLADDPSKDARERLKLVERINDGFRLAEEDLRIRGPGDYLGTRQSGLPNLKLARITDQDIVSLARREATRILEHDPDLQDNQYQELSKRLSVYEADLAVEMS
jgi:ATP-dependent DNA helicase RecG